MTARDFMDYLLYVEHSAENLQFWIWYMDYTKRFRCADTVDLALAPEWTQAMEDEAVARIRRGHAERLRPEPRAAEIFRGTDLEKQMPERKRANPFDAPPRSAPCPPRGAGGHASPRMDPRSKPLPAVPSHRSQAAAAFSSAGVGQPYKPARFCSEARATAG